MSGPGGVGVAATTPSTINVGELTRFRTTIESALTTW